MNRLSGKWILVSELCAALFFCIVLFSETQVCAEDIKKVSVEGYRYGPDISDITTRIRGDLSRAEIKSFAALITERYLEAGYVGSGVRGISFDKDGTLKLKIHEAHVTGINIKGADSIRKEISNILFPSYGEIYNIYTMKARQKKALDLPGVTSVRIKPVYMESGHIFLEVSVIKKHTEFYGGILFDMFYGTSPRLGCLVPLGDMMLDLSAEAGFREGEVKKAGGNISLYIPIRESYIFFIRTSAVRLVEEWESLSADYVKTVLTPRVGLSRIIDSGSLSLSVREDLIFTDDYPRSRRRYYDTSVGADIEISNRKFLLDKRDASWLKYTIAAGYCDIEDSISATTSFRAGTSFQPFSRFRIVPVMSIFYTSISERLYHEYVFDSMIPGFYDDYTASAWKNSLRLDAEVEVMRGFVYAGPLVSAGYFRDENDEWKYKTGTGFKTDFVFNNVILNIVFAWDAAGSPADGGLFLSADGNF